MYYAIVKKGEYELKLTYECYQDMCALQDAALNANERGVMVITGTEDEDA